MKRMIVAGIILLVFAQGLAADHVSPLRRYRVDEEKKATTGMSTSEVKAKLGAPVAVEVGFPQIESSQIILFSEPKMVGQLNYSTWFFFAASEVIRFTDDILAKTKYVINGVETTKELFEKYDGQETLYLLKGEVIDPVMGQGYKITKDPDLQVRRIDTNPSMTYVKPPDSPENSKIGEQTTAYLPVLCVIFDKGTGVVAGTRAYYRFLETNRKMIEANQTEKQSN